MASTPVNQPPNTLNLPIDFSGVRITLEDGQTATLNGQSLSIDLSSITVDRSWYIFWYQQWERSGGPTDLINTLIPVGTRVGFCGPTAPPGWLLCDGAEISRVTYSELFNEIGTAYGAGDGSTTFNVPDYRGRAVVGAGQGPGLTNRNLGDLGGEEEVTLNIDELPAHNHDFVNANNTDEVVNLDHSHDLVNKNNIDEIIGFDHNHDITETPHTHGAANSNFVTDSVGGTEYESAAGDKGATAANTAGANADIIIDGAKSFTNNIDWTDAVLGRGELIDSNVDLQDVIIGETGNNDAHENMMPFGVDNYIIRTGVIT